MTVNWLKSWKTKNGLIPTEPLKLNCFFVFVHWDDQETPFVYWFKDLAQVNGVWKSPADNIVKKHFNTDIMSNICDLNLESQQKVGSYGNYEDQQLSKQDNDNY